MSRTDSQYLESKVLTASAPQLHLMLLEGALRFGRQAQELWSSDAENPSVEGLLARMADIVDELAHSMANGEGEISDQFEEQYAFIYRELTASRLNREIDRLQDCIKLLDYQRETWKQVCEKLGSEESGTTSQSAPQLTDDPPPEGGLSLEA